MRHRQLPQHHVAAGHMDQAAAAEPVITPALVAVALGEGGDPEGARAILGKGQTVEVTAILRNPARDEGRQPAGHETPGGFEGHQPVEQGVDQPQPPPIPGQVMAEQRTAVVAGAGQKGDVMGPLRRQARRNLAAGGQRPDALAAPHSDTAGGACQPHGLVETAEVKLQATGMGADADHLASLVGRKEKGEPQAVEKLGQTGRMDVVDADRV